jgi:hypothetical protein
MKLRAAVEDNADIFYRRKIIYEISDKITIIVGKLPI